MDETKEIIEGLEHQDQEGAEETGSATIAGGPGSGSRKKPQDNQKQKSQPEAPKAEAKQPKAIQQDGAKVRIKSRVNMICLDGTHLIIGKEAELSKDELDRLEKDERGPFFDLV